MVFVEFTLFHLCVEFVFAQDLEDGANMLGVQGRVFGEDDVGQYTIGCLYGDLRGMGACAYTINEYGYGYLCSYTMVDTCVGFGAITSEFGTCPDGRIVYFSFDCPMKALMNEIPYHQQ